MTDCSIAEEQQADAAESTQRRAPSSDHEVREVEGEPPRRSVERKPFEPWELSVYAGTQTRKQPHSHSLIHHIGPFSIFTKNVSAPVRAEQHQGCTLDGQRHVCRDGGESSRGPLPPQQKYTARKTLRVLARAMNV